MFGFVSTDHKVQQNCIIVYYYNADDLICIYFLITQFNYVEFMYQYPSIQNCICFFPLETNAVFSKLGAEDIVGRYDKLLHEWKLMKDAELDFKRVMGLDHDRPLVRCLDSIPPGKKSIFHSFLYYITNQDIW